MFKNSPFLNICMILSGLCDGFLCGFKKVKKLSNKLRKQDCEKKRDAPCCSLKEFFVVMLSRVFSGIKKLRCS